MYKNFTNANFAKLLKSVSLSSVWFRWQNLHLALKSFTEILVLHINALQTIVCTERI